VARDERNRYQGEDGTDASLNASYDPEILALLSVDYKRQAITDLPSFNAEMESQQISQQSEEQKVVAFAK
jgi:hypothetical protein